MIKVDFEKAEELKNVGKYENEVKRHLDDLLAGKIEMTGWVKHPINYDKEECIAIGSCSLQPETSSWTSEECQRKGR